MLELVCFTSSASRDFIVAGSTNGTTWDLLASFSNTSWSSINQVISFDVNSSKTYSCFRIATNIVGNVGSTNHYNLVIQEGVLLGIIPPPPRVGQSNLTNEIMTLDKHIFKRPFTFKITSPTGVVLSGLSN
jgi:hypothetical protein